MSDADACPNCGAIVAAQQLIPAHPIRDVPARERATCPACALQLVREVGEAWHGIRG